MDTQLRRIPYLDNAKLLMMFLVIYGHILETFVAEQPYHLVRTFYLLIYLFHIPVFVFLAGLTSKVKTSYSGSLKLLSVYVVFQVFYTLITPHPMHEYLTMPIIPYWVLWFFLSLICWKLMLPVALKLPWPLAFGIVIALGAGAFDPIGRVLSISRTLVWFPLFLAGHLYGKTILGRASAATYTTRIIAIASFFVAGFALWKWPFDYRILLELSSYSALGIHSVATGIAVRMGHILMACILGYAALCLIPAKHNIMTQYGSRTLAMFVVHPLFVHLLRHSVLRIKYGDSVVVMAILAVVITWLSGSKPFHRLVTAIAALPQRLPRPATA
jgi:fucose 4-O-acetylase-like acetyltransferase